MIIGGFLKTYLCGRPVGVRAKAPPRGEVVGQPYRMIGRIEKLNVQIFNGFSKTNLKG
jgi:hypothetical protein